MTKKLFWVIVCILFPVIAEGADWVKVVQNNKAILYVDVSSIKQVASNQYKAWLKLKYINDELIEKDIEYELFDCAEVKSKYLQITFYQNNGRITTIGEKDWEYVTPDTAEGKGVLDFVCNYKKGVIKIPKKDAN